MTDNRVLINNLVLCNIKDNSNDEEDKQFMDNFLSKIVDFDIPKMKYLKMRLFNKKAKFTIIFILIFESNRRAIQS